MLFGRIWLVVEAAVSHGTAETLVEEQKQESDLNAFGRQAVGIAPAITLEKSVAFELAEIVVELVQSVGLGGKLTGGVAAVQEKISNIFG